MLAFNQLSQAVLLHEYDEVESTILHNIEGACEMILIISKWQSILYELEMQNQNLFSVGPVP